jgi:hypothetical protein
MLAIVPDPYVAQSTVSGTGTDDGVPSDVSLEVRSGGGMTFTVRTLLRLGESIGSSGWPQGTKN